MKMRVLPKFSIALWCASAIAVAGTPAHADIAGQPDPNDVAAIEACLAASVKTKSSSDACIGRVSAPCLEKAATASAKENCSHKELFVWTAALNRDLARLIGLLPTDRAKQELRDIERDFFADKSKRCTFERIIRGDGSDGLLTAAQCDATSTALQDLWLMEQIDSFQSR